MAIITLAIFMICITIANSGGITLPAISGILLNIVNCITNPPRFQAMPIDIKTMKTTLAQFFLLRRAIAETKQVAETTKKNKKNKSI